MQAFIKRLIEIDNYILSKETGSPAQLGEKIGVSERTVYDYLKLMRSYGACIAYSRQYRSYYYTADGRFILGFIPELVTRKGN